MSKTLIKPHAIVTMDSGRRVIKGGGILVSGNIIERVLTEQDVRQYESFNEDVLDARSLVAIPGFIQTHIHLCQTLFRGLADDLELLEWLTLRIFPYEAAHNAPSMRASALVGIAELLRSGTTTIMDMGSVHHEEEIIRAIEETGLRAFVGKSMIDENDLYPPLKESRGDALSTTRAFAERWHGSCGDRIRYAVAPRFVLSCSDRLLRDAYEMTSSFPGMLFHTHAAENRGEMEAVRRRCRMDNVEFFDSLGILHPNTCLAHCVWLNGREIDLLARRKAKVLHCPSSNLKLGSGIAGVPALLERGITVSLGADGAPCNNSLNMFQEMRLAALIQNPLHGPGKLPAPEVFAMGTLAGAFTLGLGQEIGSIDAGKKADIVLMDVSRLWNPSVDIGSNDIYSTIVYSCSPANVHSVMVDGRWLMRDGTLTFLDEERLVHDAKEELRKLLSRVHQS
jgi:5-methylthioadenosine/S-adenosylhomocysteine deaminase